MGNNEVTRHTGIPVNTYTLMHREEVVAIARRGVGVEVILPEKLPFGLRTTPLYFDSFMDWLRGRVDNLQRTYMNKVYIARQIGRDLEKIIQDSCAISIIDQFWINRSDVNMTWEKLQVMRDQNKTLAEVALTGDIKNIDWETVIQGTTSLFATKGAHPKAILGDTMLKLGKAAEREWIAAVIGERLDIPVQTAVVLNPSLNGLRDNEGNWTGKTFVPKPGSHSLPFSYDDTLVEIKLFTSEKLSLAHASEMFIDKPKPKEIGQIRNFYDNLPSDSMKRDFERILMLNLLISNADLHNENYGCLYSPETFEIIDVAPSYDHNTAEFDDDVVMNEDITEIIFQKISHHEDIINKIENGVLEEALKEISNWLSQEQKDCVRSVGEQLVNIFHEKTKNYEEHKFPRQEDDGGGGSNWGR